MHLSRSAPALPKIVALAAATLVALLLSPTLQAADNDTGPPETLNCGLEGTRDACIECDAGGPLACCDYDGEGNPTCPIINEPPTTGFTGGNFSINVAAAGLKLTLTRKVTIKNGARIARLKLKESFVSPNVRKRVAFTATFVGDDAPVASVAYAVGFMGMGEAALGALQAQGHDFSLTHSGTLATCQESFSASECTALATQLAKAIDGGLPPGNGQERTRFLESVSTLGFPPCQIFC